LEAGWETLHLPLFIPHSIHMESAIASFKQAVAGIPNRLPFSEVGRPTQQKLLRQVEEVACCILGEPTARLQKITGGNGWALRVFRKLA